MELRKEYAIYFRPYIGIGWKKKMGLTFIFKYSGWCLKWSAIKGQYFVLINIPVTLGYIGSMDFFIGYSKRIKS